MATANIIAAFQDGVFAYVTATVDEGPSSGVVEYTAKTLLLDTTGNPKGPGTLKAELALKLREMRPRQATTSPIPGISGTLNV